MSIKCPKFCRFKRIDFLSNSLYTNARNATILLIFNKTFMKKQKFFNSFYFLRRYFNIPRKKKLKWCVIREVSPSGTEFRLGVSISGTDKYIDLAQRRIFSEVSCGAVERSVCPAFRISRGKGFVYIASNGWKVSKPKSYIADIYRSSWWRPEIVKETLL